VEQNILSDRPFTSALQEGHLFFIAGLPLLAEYYTDTIRLILEIPFIIANGKNVIDYSQTFIYRE
jgi:hypothetical protein